jgi:NitT/TauT family transport system substrate-binding protein
MIKDLNIGAWVNDSYVRQAFKDLGLDYDKQLAIKTGYEVTGTDPVCNVPVADPRESGEVWIDGGDIVPFSSPACTLRGVKKFTAAGKKLDAVYLVDHELGIKVFADAAFYSVGGKDPNKPEIVPFLLKRDAESYAGKNGGKLATYTEALATIEAGR